MAEQQASVKQSKLVGEVGVWAKALQQRTGLVSTTRCHVQGFARTFGYCIHGLLMGVTGNVIGLSSINQNRGSCEQQRYVASFSNL
jgi:hypothetical protein